MTLSMPWRTKAAGMSVSGWWGIGGWGELEGGCWRTGKDLKVVEIAVFGVDVELDLAHGHILCGNLLTEDIL